MPHLGRWASADPLQVHQGEGGEFGNSYHYVAGGMLRSRDAQGLEIIIAGTASEQRASLQALQSLTTAQLELGPDNAVRVVSGPTDNNAGPAGTELVRRLISTKHKVIVTHAPPPEVVHSQQTSPGSQSIAFVPENQRNLVGTGTVVHLNFDYDQEHNRDPVIGRDGQRELVRPDNEFTLAHELIHADHNARGTRPTGTERGAWTDPNGELQQYNASTEEMQTTGLPYPDMSRRSGPDGRQPIVTPSDYRRGADGLVNITENDVRAEQGAKQRAAYVNVTPAQAERYASEGESEGGSEQ